MKKTNFRNEIIKEIKAALSWAQNDGQIANFKNNHNINVIYHNRNWEEIKNRSYQSYLKYNNHIYIIQNRYRKVEQIKISQQLFEKLQAINEKYFNGEMGLTGIFDILSSRIFEQSILDESSMATTFMKFKDRFDVYQNYEILKEKLDKKRSKILNDIRTAPAKRITKI